MNSQQESERTERPEHPLDRSDSAKFLVVMLVCPMCGNIEFRMFGTEVPKCPHHNLFDINVGPPMEYKMTVLMQGVVNPDHDPANQVETS